VSVPEGSQEQPGYQSYLLRLWRAGEVGKPVWRASLQSTHTGKQVGFASLASLFAFLEEQIAIAETRISDGEPTA
jgi:hypothetical protein